MSLRPLYARCLGLIASLPVPDPFDLEQFRANLERQRGRRLLLLPDAMATDCSGMWIGTDQADYVFYARDTTPVHQRHIVAHEIGHMVFDHRGVASGTRLDKLLFPALSPAMVRTILGRTAYSDQEEREAETFASVLLGRARLRPAAPDLQPDEAELLQRVKGAFAPAWSGHGERMS